MEDNKKKRGRPPKVRDNRGGYRENAGSKPKIDKKLTIYFGVEESKVNLLGGIKNITKLAIDLIESQVLIRKEAIQKLNEVEQKTLVNLSKLIYNNYKAKLGKENIHDYDYAFRFIKVRLSELDDSFIKKVNYLSSLGLITMNLEETLPEFVFIAITKAGYMALNNQL